MKIIRYFFVAGAAAVVDIGIFFLFAKLAGYDYLLVGCVGFLIATAVNYFLSVKHVFESGVRHTKRNEIILVYAVSLVWLAINQLVLYVMIEHAQSDLMLAKLAATGICFFWNFSARHFIVFRQNATTNATTDASTND